MIDSLQLVDWPALRHAYGPAQDVPGLIAQLRAADWDEAVEELLALLVHDGLYPATSAALPFLAEVAVDPEAPGRLGALELLTIFSAELARETRDIGAELGPLARPLLPLASDPDPEVRIALYEYACSWLGSELEAEARAILWERFAAELDVRAQVALMEPLARYGLLTAAALETLRIRGRDEVLFAAAWSALAVGLDLPPATDQLVRLWPVRAGAYPGSGAGNSLNHLVGRMGAESVPVLRRLGEASAAEIGDLAAAWLRVAEMSRAATGSALDAVLGMAARASAADAVRVLEALSALRPVAGERAREMADTVAGLLARGPSDPRVQAASAAALFALQDPRWAAPALVVAEMAEPPQIGEGSARMSLPAALAGFPASRLPVGWAQAELVAVAGRAVAVRPEAAVAWAEVLHLLPPSSAVVDVLLSAADRGPVAMTLAQLAQADPQSFTAAARATIRALPIRADETGAALLTAQALLTDDFAAFGRAWELGRSGFGADELLRLWTRSAGARSPELEAACRAVLTGAVATSIPARHLQLVAAEYLVDVGDRLAAWPTVRALVDRAGEPLMAAMDLAARIVRLEPGLLAEWKAQLRDILEHGRRTWAGLDPVAVVVAAGQLFDLGELDPEPALERILAAERDAVAAWQAGQATPVVTHLLGRLLAVRPHLCPQVTRALATLVTADARIPTAADVIAVDTRLTALLRPFV